MSPDASKPPPNATTPGGCTRTVYVAGLPHPCYQAETVGVPCKHQAKKSEEAA